MKSIDWRAIEYFTPREFINPYAMDAELLRWLDLIRGTAGVSIKITSSYREGDDGAHGEGLAVDISDNLEGNPIASRWRFEVLRAVFSHNIDRIGDYDRHLHLDVSTTRDRNVCWWGVSD